VLTGTLLDSPPRERSRVSFYNEVHCSPGSGA
jgi:hypothetical protein